MKIYIAAKYGHAAHIKEKIAPRIEALGHEVTSHWINGDEEGKGPQGAAVMDVADVLRADCCLSLSEPYGSENKGGGRHFEFGMAYQAGKRCIVVGHLEIVFHHLESVEYYPDLDAALEAL